MYIYIYDIYIYIERERKSCGKIPAIKGHPLFVQAPIVVFDPKVYRLAFAVSLCVYLCDASMSASAYHNKSVREIPNPSNSSLFKYHTVVRIP